MINEEHTRVDFGHTSDMLSKGSHKLVWRICEVCRKESEVKYQNYTRGYKICKPCAKKNRRILKRGPFDIKYFTTVQESINDGGINELKTFDEFKYYSIDLSDGNGNKVWRICNECGKENKVEYNSYTNGHIICNSCTRTGKTHSEESRQKMSAFRQNIPHEEWDGYLTDSPYPVEFTEKLRREIRASTNDRDFLTGEHKNICNNGQELSVHHIDYDKQNCDIRNLIPLSKSNHAKTNIDRAFWEKLFTNMQNTRYLLLELNEEKI